MNTALLLSLAMAATALQTQFVRADTFLVLPDGTGDFPTIQAAVDAADAGDVVELGNGTFTGTGNRDVDFLGKAITVRSQSGDAATCVLDCEGSPGEPHRGFLFVSGETGSSSVENITITNGYGETDGGDVGGGIYCDRTAPRIVGCWFIGNSSEVGGGIGVRDSSPTIEDCVFALNEALFGGGVAILTGDPIFTGCTFVGNEAADGSAIFSIGSLPSLLTIERTILAFNLGGPAMECLDFGEVDVSCTDVFGNEGGDWVECLEGLEGEADNFSVDPLFCDAENRDYSLGSTSPCAADNNPACGQVGALGIGCDSPTPIMGTSWGRIKERFFPKP